MAVGYSSRNNGDRDPVTFGPLIGTVGAPAAAGSASTDATLLTYALNLVTAGDNTKGVILPAVTDNLRVGTVFTVYNNSASNLKVYAGSGGKINDDGAANSATTVATYTVSTFILIDATSGANKWIASEPAKA